MWYMKELNQFIAHKLLPSKSKGSSQPKGPKLPISMPTEATGLQWLLHNQT